MDPINLAQNRPLDTLPLRKYTEVITEVVAWISASVRGDGCTDARVGLPGPDDSLVPSDSQKQVGRTITDRPGGADLAGNGAADGGEVE